MVGNTACGVDGEFGDGVGWCNPTDLFGRAFREPDVAVWARGDAVGPASGRGDRDLADGSDLDIEVDRVRARVRVSVEDRLTQRAGATVGIIRHGEGR